MEEILSHLTFADEADRQTLLDRAKAKAAEEPGKVMLPTENFERKEPGRIEDVVAVIEGTKQDPVILSILKRAYEDKGANGMFLSAEEKAERQ